MQKTSNSKKEKGRNPILELMCAARALRVFSLGATCYSLYCGCCRKTISLMDVSVPSFWRGEVMQNGGGGTRNSLFCSLLPPFLTKMWCMNPSHTVNDNWSFPSRNKQKYTVLCNLCGKNIFSEFFHIIQNTQYGKNILIYFHIFLIRFKPLSHQ